jgi:hypothetical protein
VAAREAAHISSLKGMSATTNYNCQKVISMLRIYVVNIYLSPKNLRGGRSFESLRMLN